MLVSYSAEKVQNVSFGRDHSREAAGQRANLAFVSYAADPERNLVIAMGVVDNLGKGAAGQAVQNANLICGLPETAGLDGVPVWP